MNVDKIRADFPILQRPVKGKPVIYFDNACMALKPQPVLDAINEYYTEYTACHGRSLHPFSVRTNEEYQKAHKTVAKFVGAKENEIVFTRNTTEAINLVANTLDFEKNDEVITTNLEHNSNLIPWIKMQKEGKIKHVYTIMKKQGVFDLEDFEKKITDKTKLVSLVFTSNVTGTTLPVHEIVKIAHDHDALVMLDAAQTVPHKAVNVKKLDTDFLAFSGHKMLGPTGTGALYGKYELLDKLPQFLVGGETVVGVEEKDYKIEKVPQKFEAGLQNYAGAVGFAAAAEYLTKLGMENVERHEHKLGVKMTKGLLEMPQIDIYSPHDEELVSGICSFNVRGMDTHDVALILSETENIFTRSGMHCAHLYHTKYLGLDQGSVRPSLYIYNTEQEIDKFFETMNNIVKLAK